MSLADKVALVTGAGTGIGRAAFVLYHYLDLEHRCCQMNQVLYHLGKEIVHHQVLRDHHRRDRHIH